MDESNVSVRSVSVKWGMINALAGIILFVIIDLAGLITNQAVQWLGGVVYIVLVVLAHKEFKEQGDGFLSYGQGLGIGTLIALSSSLVSGSFTYIYTSFINVEYVEILKENQLMQLENQGMSDVDIEVALSYSEPFMTPVAIAGFAIFFGVLGGFLFSLVITIFTKKPQPEFE